jgi:hypothetical protein
MRAGEDAPGAFDNRPGQDSAELCSRQIVAILPTESTKFEAIASPFCKLLETCFTHALVAWVGCLVEREAGAAVSGGSGPRAGGRNRPKTVIPVLCFVDSDWGLLSRPLQLGEAVVTWPRSFVGCWRNRGRSEPGDVAAVARTLPAALPSA